MAAMPQAEVSMADERDGTSTGIDGHFLINRRIFGNGKIIMLKKFYCRLYCVISDIFYSFILSQFDK